MGILNSIKSFALPEINWVKWGAILAIILTIVAIGVGFYYYNKNKDESIQKLNDRIITIEKNNENLRIENEQRKAENDNLNKDVALVNKTLSAQAENDKKVQEELAVTINKIDRRPLDEIRDSPHREQLLGIINKYFDGRVRPSNKRGRGANGNSNSVPAVTDSD